jgi:hypothetical protein
MRQSRVTNLRELFAKVDVVPGGCWTWTGGLQEGYGICKALRPGGSRLVYKQVYEMLVKTVPEDLQLDHLCRNRACCNPAHLDPVPQKVNILRGEGACAQHARKTHCKRGHEFTPENTGKASNNGRYCIICSRAAAKRQRARNHKGIRGPKPAVE